jgi:hypothetical protein
VTITEPVRSSTIRREAIAEADGTQPVFDTTRVRVSAEVSWPDGFPRIIQSAQLFANGNLEGSIEPAPNQTQFEFEWDLSDITNEGINSVLLEVKIVDELDLPADAESVINVEVIIPDATGSGGSKTSILGSILLFVAGVIVAGSIGAGIYFYIIRKRSSTEGIKPETDIAETPATIFASDYQEPALATLTVLEGPSGLIGEVFKINSPETVIGRNPTQTDIVFYADEESSVSRRHCTIQIDDNNIFKLIDNNSSAGTRLNGRQIHPDLPIVLDDGDEIVLGKLAQRGVKLQFNFATEESLGPYSGSADDRTHLISDL